MQAQYLADGSRAPPQVAAGAAAVAIGAAAAVHQAYGQQPPVDPRFSTNSGQAYGQQPPVDPRFSTNSGLRQRPTEFDALYETYEVPGYGGQGSGFDPESGKKPSQEGWPVARLFFPSYCMYAWLLILFATAPIILGRACAILIATLLLLLSGYLLWGQDKILKYGGALCILAIAGGVYRGLDYEQQYFVPYMKYKNGPTYTDVQPSDPAKSRADGAIINFNDRALVDTLKTGAIMAYEGTRFCAAPIFDESQQNRAEFWAVGTNCCERQTGFHCDDSADLWSAFKQGLVVYNTDTEFSFPAYKHWMIAVNQSAARNALQIPKEPVLLRWVHDAEKIINMVLFWGILSILVNVCVSFCTCYGFGWVVYSIVDLKDAPTPKMQKLPSSCTIM